MFKQVPVYGQMSHYISKVRVVGHGLRVKLQIQREGSNLSLFRGLCHLGQVTALPNLPDRDDCTSSCTSPDLIFILKKV